MNDFLIGVVGNCASGKTTLVQGLLSRGLRAVNIPQEHSAVPRLWQKHHPDFLVMLSCDLSTAKRRRHIPWGQERLDAQAARLADARAHCQLYLPTDNLTIEQVLQRVITAINHHGKESPHVGQDNTGRPETSPQGRKLDSLRT